MRLYRDRAVVLRQHKLGEADRIVTLLTRDHGMVRAVAKGVRRTRSKFGARLAGRWRAREGGAGGRGRPAPPEPIRGPPAAARTHPPCAGSRPRPPPPPPATAPPRVRRRHG